MSSNLVNEECIPIFITKSPKVTNQKSVEAKSNVTLAVVEEELLLLTTLLHKITPVSITMMIPLMT